ncbi:transcriptional regulator [Kribbella sp.]|uniref:transcriptional regulator n=1 Tax=Kribbella sp. TaxID=1871183 RepID=UPI002D6300B2|nr:transcriptional regulator [Kribbella sp.]HZX09218.1 transcriptional regulator [Kribbella sp.]
MLLVLHAVRLLGFAHTRAVAERFGLPVKSTEEMLRDAEARGWVAYSSFAGTAGWSLTEAGRTENERRLAGELTGSTKVVQQVYDEFLPLNKILQQACTDWQLRPVDGDPLGVNDHSDAAWDAGVLDELRVLSGALHPLVKRLTEALPRFQGYDVRFANALEHGWVDRSDVDSCHRVWFELHEDLLATLGLKRS